MTRHGATPRRQWPDWSWPRLRLPQWPWRRILVCAGILAALAGGLRVLPAALNQPVVWEARGDWINLDQQEVLTGLKSAREQGFWELDLAEIRRTLETRAWVDAVSLTRHWPNRVVVTLTEQVPLAVWNDSGLINHRGEVFYPEQASRLTTGSRLPALSAPAGSAETVMNYFLRFSQVFHQQTERLVALSLAERGAWTMNFANGVEVRLGQRDILQRAQRVARVLKTVRTTGRGAEIQAIDARYQHAVAVAWKSGESA